MGSENVILYNVKGSQREMSVVLAVDDDEGAQNDQQGDHTPPKDPIRF
jgi:hypothetical protein